MDFNLDKQLIYLDNHLIVLNKPAGLRVIPDGYDPSLSNLKNLLLYNFNNIYIVHRLDKDTSGVMLFALDKETHKNLNEQFTNRTINKKYISICANIPEWKYLSYQSKIKVNGDRKHRTVHHEQGKLSKTDFMVYKTNKLKQRSVILSALKTGYTHQIRSHLSYLGFPILCDPLYKNIHNHQIDDTPSLLNRLALHALKIVFFHPFLNKRVCYEAPIPEDIQSIMF
ncbi:MAG: RNA pseudouridine synthase [Anaerolineaceae bacterium]|nr:RNA pseudouridine synthase [Anaerolineaceae bacterium]